MAYKSSESIGELVIFRRDDGSVQVDCRFIDSNLWLTQRLMGELYNVGVNTVNYHIKSILENGELDPKATIRKYRIVQREGQRQIEREVEHYSLEMVLAVGYRVRSHVGTEFRQWATVRLKEYMIKGFVMDDERLKNPPGPDVPDYFDELLHRIRDIRSSEKRLYLKVRNIFALAADYQPNAEETQQFFQTIQNKLLWTVTHATAPELIASRADHRQPNMGLTNWKGTKVRKTDVTVAKNYLEAQEIDELNRIVGMYLDYAEDQAKRRRVLYMSDWRNRLDAFLKFNERDILDNPGHVSREVADRLAQEEYDKFHTWRLAADAETANAEILDEALKQLSKRREETKRDE
ncbi:MAG: virulence RhuM family protein [Candidatus Sumerlaeaceae bacterium]